MLLQPGGRFLVTDAGVVTGSISDDEVRRRSRYGHTELVAPGRNETLLEAAGFRVIEVEDRTASVVKNASGRLMAMNAHRSELERMSSTADLDAEQRYLETVVDLSRRGVLSRFMYLAELGSDSSLTPTPTSTPKALAATMPELTLDHTTTALVLIDLQRGITAGQTVPHAAADVIARAARLIAACRPRGVPIVLVRVDPGPDGVLFPRPQADQPRPPMAISADWAELVPELGREASDVVVTKHQPNAFYATDLEVQLQRRGVRTIILGGISTNVGVEATARAAHERGYEQIFVSDVMAAREADLHEHSVKRIFPTLGRVRTLDVVLAAVGR